MPRVALIHDFLLDLRGAERVFAAICDAWPDADVFTAVYDETGHRGPLRRRATRRRRSCSGCGPTVAHVPAAAAAVPARGRVARPARLRHRRLQSSSAWAHGVLVDPGAVHVCYCHNPFRYAWSEREATLAARNPLTRAAAARRCSRAGASGTGSRPSASTPTSPTRRSPRRASGATSGASRRSCTRRWSSRASRPAPVGAHYLVLAELMAHKRIDVASAPSTRSAGRWWSSATGRSGGGCGGSRGRRCG